ncbi:G-type lectin S-receptor-like serine/threonine-protein kinase RKS1 [Linum perenne]
MKQLSLNSETLNPNKPLRDGDVFLSSSQTFDLGFFSPDQNPIRRYLGIWYHRVSKQTVVWVANRDSPLNDSSGRLTLDSTGNLNLHAGNGTESLIWSANLTIPIQNSGNLASGENEISVCQLLTSVSLKLKDKDKAGCGG